MREIDLGNAQLLTEDQTRELWIKQGKCEHCGLVKVVEKINSRNFFSRHKRVLITTHEVFEGYHLSCYGGHSNLIRYFKDNGRDTSTLEAHFKKYRHRVKRSVPNPTHTNDCGSTPVPNFVGGEIVVPQNHSFPSDDVSLLSSVSEKVLTTIETGKRNNYMSQIQENEITVRSPSNASSSPSSSAHGVQRRDKSLQNSEVDNNNQMIGESHQSDIQGNKSGISFQSSAPSKAYSGHRKDISRESIELDNKNNKHVALEHTRPLTRNEKLMKKMEEFGGNNNFDENRNHGSSSIASNNNNKVVQECKPTLTKNEKLMKKMEEYGANNTFEENRSVESSAIQGNNKTIQKRTLMKRMEELDISSESKSAHRRNKSQCSSTSSTTAKKSQCGATSLDFNSEIKSDHEPDDLRNDFTSIDSRSSFLRRSSGQRRLETAHSSNESYISSVGSEIDSYVGHVDYLSLGKPLDEIIMDDESYSNPIQKYRKIFELMRQRNGEAAFIKISFIKIRESILSDMTKLNTDNENSSLLPNLWSKNLVAAMEQHAANRLVQEEALRTFHVLVSIHTDHKDNFVSSAGIDATIKSLKRHIFSLPVAMMAIGLLVNLALSKYSKRIAYSNKDIVHVMADLFNVPRRIDDFYFNQSIFICKGALQIIQLLLNINRASRAITSKDIVTEIGKHEYFLQNLIYGIEECSADKALLHHIFNFLLFLSSLSEEETSEDIAEFLRLHRLWRAVINATNQLISWESFQVVALALIANLSTRENIGSSTILMFSKNIFTAMKEHVQSEQVQIHGYTLITNLCNSDPENQIALNKLGGIELITSYLKTNKSNTLVVARGCQALSALVNDSSLMKDKFAEGDIEIVLDVLKANLEDDMGNASDSIDQIFYLLATMLEIDSVALILFSHGFFQLILSESMLNKLIEFESFQLFLRNLISIGECPDDLRQMTVKILPESNFLTRKNKSNDLENSIDLIGYLFSSGDDKKDSTSSARKKISVLIRILNTFEDSTFVHEEACVLLSEIYMVQGQDIHGSTEISMEVVSPLSVLLRNAMKPDIQQSICLTIFHFVNSLGSEGIDDAFDLELSYVIRTMADLLLQPNIQPVVIEIITGIIWSLSNVKESIEKELFSSQCLRLLINAFLRFETEINMQKEILGFIAHFRASEYRISELLCTEPCIKALFNSLELNFEVEEFVERGCSVIALLSADVYNFQHLIVNNIDYLSTLVGLLYRYKESVDILMDVYTALSNCSIHFPVKKFLSSQGVIGLATESIIEYSENEDLNLMASSVICNLSRVADIRILEGLNIVSFCLTTMKANIDNELIIEKYMETLNGLATNNQSFENQVKDQDEVIWTIIKIMKKHLGSEIIQEKGCLVLWTLASLSDDIILQIYRNGGVEAVLNGMSAHIESSTLQQEGLGTLKALGARPFTRRAIIDNKGIEVILGSMWFHFDNELVQSFSLMALSNCSYDTEKDEVSIVTEKELETIANSMALYPDSEKVQENACRLLRNYTFQSINTKLMVSNDQLLKLLQTAADKFPSSCKGRAEDIVNCLAEALLLC